MIIADPHPSFQEYAHPQRIVSAPWLSARLGVNGLRVIEVDEDALLYDIGHIPTATRINFHTELLDQRTRDVVGPEDFAQLMRSKGINRDDTVVLYGDKNNWWAAYALWVFELYGHPDVRLLDGGRDAWMSEERDTSYSVPEYPHSDYPLCPREESGLRVFVDGLDGHTLVDTRSPEEYRGEPTSTSAAGDSDYGTTIRHGHIPGAVNIPWSVAVFPNSTFRARADLDVAYTQLDPTAPTVLYSHLGAQAAHTWFVLKFLLGFERVANYDGSWAEWGNMVRMPIERG
ncbi:sulfurtransferase [Corynebacterium lizhenjunii]|uniref:sulfurtransferase n=1 Tax=Corynebacterium lizhenjunii TaxID=2709394 RepID=UPI0013E9ACBD|nr:sulfurtransferase [Corynebacterium lizhenjunii]